MRAHFAPLQAVEQDDLVNTIEELRPERLARTMPITWSRTAAVSSPSAWLTKIFRDRGSTS